MSDNILGLSEEPNAPSDVETPILETGGRREIKYDRALQKMAETKARGNQEKCGGSWKAEVNRTVDDGVFGGGDGSGGLGGRWLVGRVEQGWLVRGWTF